MDSLSAGRTSLRPNVEKRKFRCDLIAPMTIKSIFRTKMGQADQDFKDLFEFRDFAAGVVIVKDVALLIKKLIEGIQDAENPACYIGRQNCAPPDAKPRIRSRYHPERRAAKLAGFDFAGVDH